MKIKIKILAGFVLIIAMLIVAGLMSIFEFSRLGKSISALIDDNYKTIEASKTMIEALEREESGILLLVSGQWKEGRQILQSADSLFGAAFFKAKNNITEMHEENYIGQIEKSYKEFKHTWELPIVGTSKEHNIDWYFSELHPNFIKVKTDVNALMTLNQDSMYQESTVLKEKTHRAIMPGIVAIISALVFLIIFNFFISKYFVKSIGNLIYSLKHYNSQKNIFDAGITTKDEFKELENEIQNLIDKLTQSN